MVEYACNPSIVGQKPENPEISLASQPSQNTQNFLSYERTCLKAIRQEVTKDNTQHPTVAFTSCIWVHTATCIPIQNTHMHTHSRPNHTINKQALKIITVS